MQPTIQFLSGGPELIGGTEPLWHKQKDHHLQIDTIHPEAFVDIEFSERMKQLTDKAERLFVVLARDSESDETVGYSLATITPNGIGEVDSIFVDEGHRNQGIGTELVSRTLEWMHAQNVGTVRMHVLDVNQGAHRLYQRMGFVTRQLELIRKQPTPE